MILSITLSHFNVGKQMEKIKLENMGTPNIHRKSNPEPFKNMSRKRETIRYGLNAIESIQYHVKPFLVLEETTNTITLAFYLIYQISTSISP